MGEYQLQSKKKQYNWEEYLQLEKESELKYEYHDGRVVCMAGGTNRHNEITLNFCTTVKRKVFQQGCKTYSSDVKLFRYQSEKYFYPDGIITCNPLDLQTHSGVRNPLLIVEVLSKTTRDTDRSFKLREYLKLPSLNHYLLIEQIQCEVQHFRRKDENSWEVLFYDQMEETIEIPELGISLPLADVYEGVEFGPEPDILEEEELQYGVEQEVNP